MYTQIHESARAVIKIKNFIKIGTRRNNSCKQRKDFPLRKPRKSRRAQGKEQSTIKIKRF